MCGLAGAVLPDGALALQAVEAMCEQMLARGPDDGGIEAVHAGGPAVVLGSRRLAVIDLSPRGHQPMKHAEKGTTIVFNGMIYNFRELRRRLERDGERFGSDCDTEVVLRAYGRWGRDCVRELRGMFAFAIWDEPRRELVLARDRLGIKPLYYAHDGAELLFASQVKALLATRLVQPRLDAAGIASYLAFGSVAEPLTAIAGVRALPAAHVATLAHDGRLTVERYWSFPHVTADAAGTREQAAAELEQLLRESVRLHLVSDAPLGVFLSGGLDSTVLAALAAQAGGDLRTVSVAFAEATFDEAPDARLVAEHVGSQHTEVTLGATDLLDAAQSAFAVMDQPTTDGFNTFVVSRAASASGLKVALSGLGGDELFDGYGHVRKVRLLERALRVPRPLRRTAASLVDSRNAKTAAWLRGALRSGGSMELLRRVFLPDALSALVRQPSFDGAAPPTVARAGDLYNAVSVADLGHYTKNTLLRDTDAMSMAHSLEVRVPFLDHALVEWALQLPERVKTGGHKALLVAACGHLLPPAILSRRKQGFDIPIGLWLRRELREEVGETLRRPPAAVAELVDTACAQAVWERYLDGGRRPSQPWALYALSRWVRTVA